MNTISILKYILTIYFPLYLCQPSPVIYSYFFCANGYFEIPLYITNNQIQITAKVSQVSSKNYILNTLFNPQQSITSKLIKDQCTSINVKGKLIESLVYTDNIKTEKMTQFISDFLFYSIDQDENLELKSNCISLLLNFPTINSTSLVHLMKQQGLINRLSYTFKNCLYHKSELEFGNEPSMLENVHKCKVDPISYTWNCKMNSIHIVNDSQSIYAFKYAASFDVGRNKTTVPCSFIDFLIEKIMNVQFQNGDCQLFEYDNKKRIQCNDLHTIQKMPSLQINFEEFSLELKMNTFFACYLYVYCYSLFKCRKGLENDWVFGSSFIRHFEITFDYEDKAVLLKSSSYYINIKANHNINPQKTIQKEKIPIKYTNLQSIINIINILLIITCLLLLFIKYKLKFK
jgi:hypothetical protein